MVAPNNLNLPGVVTNGVHFLHLKYQYFSRNIQENCQKIITRVPGGKPGLNGIKGISMIVLIPRNLTFEV